MKILVLGLDGAVPELLFGDEGLSTIRQLMEMGCFGPVKSTVPPSAVPAWASMTASQDPGTLGVYGPRTRKDRSYDRPTPVESDDLKAEFLGDVIRRAGKHVHSIGVPPWEPSPSFSPETGGGELSEEVGQPFAAAREVLASGQWDYLHLVTAGPEFLHRCVAMPGDLPSEGEHQPDAYPDVVRDFYRGVDAELAGLFELLDEETIVLVLSCYGSQPVGSTFYINEWLLREGDLVLNSTPEKPTPFSELDVHWEATRAWAEDGCGANLFLNVKGREPQGIIEPGDCQQVRDELKQRLEQAVAAMPGSVVLKPEEIYRQLRGVAPDLMAVFGDYRCQPVSSVAAEGLSTETDKSRGNAWAPTPQGSFILAAPNLSLAGEMKNVDLLQLAPTLLEAAGYEVPASMQGHPFTSDNAPTTPTDSGPSVDEEELIRQRLSGLGYI